MGGEEKGLSAESGKNQQKMKFVGKVLHVPLYHAARTGLCQQVVKLNSTKVEMGDFNGRKGEGWKRKAKPHN